MKRTLFGCCVALAGVAGLGALARYGTKKKTAAAAQPEEIKAPAGRPQTINWAMNYGGARLVVPTLWHQAGRVVFDLLILPDQPDFGYDGAYYYMDEPGAPLGLGFACVSEVEMLGGGLYRVYFGVYGMGEAIGDEVYTLLPEQAASLYTNTPFQGCATIRALGLGTREGFRLESLRIE